MKVEHWDQRQPPAVIKCDRCDGRGWLEYLSGPDGCDECDGDGVLLA